MGRRKINHINIETMGESKIRELNDEINKLLREKGHWEKRIKDLGGPNYYVINYILFNQKFNLIININK